MAFPCQLRFQVGKFGLEFLPRRFAVDREIASPGLAADMRKTQEVEGLRRASLSLRSSLLCVASEFDQPRFLWVEFQAKPGKPLSQCD